MDQKAQGWPIRHELFHLVDKAEDPEERRHPDGEDEEHLEKIGYIHSLYSEHYRLLTLSKVKIEKAARMTKESHAPAKWGRAPDRARFSP